MAWLWGFSVDDAFISARVAHHLANGHGYRFNAEGPIVDAVTPLGWALLLAPFARSSVTETLVAAQWLGAAAWVTAAGALGREWMRLGWHGLAVGALGLLVNAPLAAWSVSGMETGVVTALACVGVLPGTLAAPALGLAAALRPELAPWAAAIAVGRGAWEGGSRSPRARLFRAARGLAWVAGGCVLVGVLRTHFFGHAYPLSLVAKPSDVQHGARYALGALLLSGPPLLLATRVLRRASVRTRIIAAALPAHVVSLIVAGGDWMPLYRLFVPVLPSLLLAAAELAQLKTAGPARAVRLGAMLAVCAAVGITLGPSARAVGTQRGALIEAARPLLSRSRIVAALDVGWLGAATSASIVDLAGVTDPTIARLPGGHTTKRLPAGLLESRNVDALVLLAEAPRLTDWPDLAFARGVEARIPGLASIEQFQARALLPLRGTRQAYVLAQKRVAAAP